MQRGLGGSELRCAASGRLRIVIPLALIGVSLWLLVGCLYIPTGNNLHLSGTKMDFRPLVGEPGSKQPITAGTIERGRVERILGRPPFESDDHSRVMYVLHVKSGVVILPVCFTAVDATDTGIGLLLVYDPDGRLRDWKRLDINGGFSPMGDPYGFGAGQGVQDRLDRYLLWHANDSPTTRYSDQSPQAERWRLKPTKR